MDRRLRRQNRSVCRSEQPATNREKKLLGPLRRTLVFLVILWMLLTFVRSDYFSLETIVVNGHVRTTEEKIKAALQVSEGENIWRIRPSQLQERLQSIPRISSAKVERRLPRTLVVSVQEKKTLILVPYREHLLEVGMDGQVLGSTRERQEFFLPLLTGTGPVEISVGQTLLSGIRLDAVRTVMIALEEHGLNASELNVADPENMVLIMMDGLVVWLGRDEYAEKIWLLQQISHRMSVGDKAGYLDLRVKEAPVFRAVEQK